MGKVLKFERKPKVDPVAEKLVAISAAIDEIIMENLLDDDIELRDIVGLLSHRMGTLMRHIDNKDSLWVVCEKVLKKQAKID